MTQPPPPPPQQPPGGGFGPPQDPGQAAPQPGYGYPPAAGQPPQPPQGPAGYGYPGQQPGPYGPNPYGQPGPPYGQPGYGPQPGYGYPQPAMPLQPQPGQPGGGRTPNARLAVIVASVAALALIIGGGVWYLSSKDDGKKTETAGNTAGTSGGTGGGSDDGNGGPTSPGKEKAPADPASKVLFQVPAPEVKNGSTVAVAGSWLTDDAYVKSGIAEINGYDRDKGSKLWTIPLPGPVCQAGRHVTDDGLTAVVHQPAMPTQADPFHGCSRVALLDLDKGKKLWTKNVKTGDRPISFDNVTISGATIAVGSLNGGAAFDVSGKLLWRPKPSASCYDAGYGGGAKLVAVRRCGSSAQRQLHIQTIDPKSGKVISEYKMAQGIEYASIVSTDPLVVAADVGDSAGDGSGISDFFSIDNRTGKLRTRIAAPGEQFAARCEGVTRIEYCNQLAVGNDRLYLPTEEHDGDGEYSRTNEIVAFDLATGKQTGQRADAGDGYRITPLRMDGGNVIAYKRPPYDKGGQIVSIDGGSFEQTKLLENPSADRVRRVETRMSPDYSELLFADGHLFMSRVYASKRSGGTTEKEYLAVGFGTS